MQLQKLLEDSKNPRFRSKFIWDAQDHWYPLQDILETLTRGLFLQWFAASDEEDRWFFFLKTPILERFIEEDITIINELVKLGCSDQIKHCAVQLLFVFWLTPPASEVAKLCYDKVVFHYLIAEYIDRFWAHDNPKDEAVEIVKIMLNAHEIDPEFPFRRKDNQFILNVIDSLK